MIRTTGLTKDYGSRRAIENLTFEANQGEVVGFLGPNGAGKTTTMRILAGYMPPTFGTAQIAGFDVVEESIEVRRRVGYLPETVPLYSDMTVFDYLKFMADLRHLPNGDEMVDNALEMVQMEQRADGYISNLSKGMRQRVGLAQALLHKPEVLILDEPTIGLDPAQVVEPEPRKSRRGRKLLILIVVVVGILIGFGSAISSGSTCCGFSRLAMAMCSGQRCTCSGESSPCLRP